MDIVVTTYCNLKCSKCANLLNLYEQPQHIDFNELKQDIKKVYELTHTDHFNILGGETFLYPYIIDLILYVQNFDVNNIYVYTNGTINLDLSKLQNKLLPKVKFYIQDYPGSKEKDKLAEQCKTYGFNYEILTYNWVDYGNLERCPDGKERFNLCQRKCNTLLNGKLYICPRAAHAHNLGIIQLPPNNYVDLHQDNLKQQYHNFFYAQEQPTCEYCFIGSQYEKEIKRGT